MDPIAIGSEIEFEIDPYFRAYKDGRVERYIGTDLVPPSTDSPTGASSKDVLISPETGLSCRVYLPAGTSPGQKLPLVVYHHGGGIFLGSASSALYHNHVAMLVKEANVMAVSVDYRIAPEHLVPTAYHDSWTTLKWVVSHFGGGGPEPWITEHGDFGRFLLAGDSIGGNIAFNMAVQAGKEGLEGGVRVSGLCMVHPYFGGGAVEPVWRYVCPDASGAEDWRVNPAADGGMAGIGCGRVLVCVAREDELYGNELWFLDMLRGSEWRGELEVFETPGEGHVFHLLDPSSDKAEMVVRCLLKFLST